MVYNKVSCPTIMPDGIQDCSGIYCLQVTAEKSFCICPYNKIGHGCHENKPGKCASGTGKNFFCMST